MRVFGLWISGGKQGIEIASLSVRQAYFEAVMAIFVSKLLRSLPRGLLWLSGACILHLMLQYAGHQSFEEHQRLACQRNATFCDAGPVQPPVDVLCGKNAILQPVHIFLHCLQFAASSQLRSTEALATSTLGVPACGRHGYPHRSPSHVIPVEACPLWPREHPLLSQPRHLHHACTIEEGPQEHPWTAHAGPKQRQRPPEELLKEVIGVPGESPQPCAEASALIPFQE